MECYSCGKPANPDSPRNFCDECDAHFEEGLKHQELVKARAWLLEEARFNGDRGKFQAVMGEIFSDVVLDEPEPGTVKMASTAKARVAEGAK